MNTRVLVTGSRRWTDIRRMRAMLAVTRELYPGAVLVHGDCKGADRIAAGIWRSWRLPVEPHPADWHRHGHAAGPIRNRHMVRLGADLCVAFLRPDSRGTVHCAALAEHAGIRTIRIHQGVTP